MKTLFQCALVRKANHFRYKEDTIMKKTKAALAILTALSMMAGLAGCGGSGASPTDGSGAATAAGESQAPAEFADGGGR